MYFYSVFHGILLHNTGWFAHYPARVYLNGSNLYYILNAII